MTTKAKPKSVPHLARWLRSATGETYYIHDPARRKKDGTNPAYGLFQLEIAERLYNGTLLIFTRISKALFEQTIDTIYGLIPEMRDDFILNVYRAVDIGSYSDVVTEEDRRFEPAVKADLESMAAEVRKVIGRHQSARGKLNEHALCSYFMSLGYQAEIAPPELDRVKIDVVARTAAETVYAQAKLGSCTSGEMRSVARNAASRPNPEGKVVVAAITADSFPVDREVLRRQIEREEGVTLWCIFKNEVLARAPEYRGVVGTPGS